MHKLCIPQALMRPGEAVGSTYSQQHGCNQIPVTSCSLDQQCQQWKSQALPAPGQLCIKCWPHRANHVASCFCCLFFPLLKQRVLWKVFFQPGSHSFPPGGWCSNWSYASASHKADDWSKDLLQVLVQTTCTVLGSCELYIQSALV